MSYLLNSSSSVFSGILNSVNSNYGLSCQFRNLSSIPLKNINVIIVDNDLDKKLWNLHKSGAFEPVAAAPTLNLSTTTPTTTTTSSTTGIPPIPIISPKLFDDDDDVGRADYDYEGAFIYIVFILVFYSLSVILMILIQTKRSGLYDLDEGNGFDGTAARNVFKRIRSENIEREALEDLRDVAWREKLWSIYTSNPNNYKIRRLESKRMQQIDRKLRQYYAVDKLDPAVQRDRENHYRTFDPSQLDTRHSFRDGRAGGGPGGGGGAHAGLLLKDINKFEYHHSVSAPPTPVGLTTNASEHNMYHHHTHVIPAHQISLTKPVDLSRPRVPQSMMMTESSASAAAAASAAGAGPRRLSNRFTVEKIKNDIV